MPGRSRPGDAERKEEAHAIGAAEVEILPNHGFEEVTPLDRPRKHLGEAEADLHLLQGEAM
jgi:hypothetical protein